jgi:pyruvate dehydrogenase E2 component (dihydrolipoamide acetyltransferase)
MARAFKLPDLGEGIHEGEVITVLVSVGDQVEEGDPILEVETDKAAVEIPSPYTGKVLEIMVQPGQVVKVGDVLLTFSNGEQPAAEAEPSPGAAEPEKPFEAKPAVPAQRREAPPAKAPNDQAPALATDRKSPVPASPATRRLARELGVDLHRVSPTGPGGLVTADDVRTFASLGEERGLVEAYASVVAVPLEEAAATAVAPPLPDFSKWGPVERVPLRSIRRATARQMTIAWSQIPHVSSQDEIDVTRLEAARRRNKKEVEAAGGRLTLTVFTVKAVAAALKQFPQFNVSVDPAKGEIIRKNYCHIGVAADTGEGLVVPVVRDVDRKSILELAVEINELVQRTRARKVSLEELRGSTFTVTNIGAAGGRGHFAPIINYPEAAILGMGMARLKPVVKPKPGGSYEIVPRMIMPVVLAFDHRVLDGVDGANFLEFFRTTLEDPGKFLLTI